MVKWSCIGYGLSLDWRIIKTWCKSANGRTLSSSEGLITDLRGHSIPDNPCISGDQLRCTMMISPTLKQIAGLSNIENDAAMLYNKIEACN